MTPSQSVSGNKAGRRCFCYYCGKGFNRDEHLERHMMIHPDTQSKPYKCIVCHMPFGRRDLLSRHMTIHNKDPDGNDVPGGALYPAGTSKSAGRVPIACKQCAASKTKCDKQHPCSRCRNKGLQCEMREQKRERKTQNRMSISRQVPGTPGDNVSQYNDDDDDESDSSSVASSPEGNYANNQLGSYGLSDGPSPAYSSNTSVRSSEDSTIDLPRRSSAMYGFNNSATGGSGSPYATLSPSAVAYPAPGESELAYAARSGSGGSGQLALDRPYATRGGSSSFGQASLDVTSFQEIQWSPSQNQNHNHNQTGLDAPSFFSAPTYTGHNQDPSWAPLQLLADDTEQADNNEQIDNNSYDFGFGDLRGAFAQAPSFQAFGNAQPSFPGDDWSFPDMDNMLQPAQQGHLGNETLTLFPQPHHQAHHQATIYPPHAMGASGLSGHQRSSSHSKVHSPGGSIGGYATTMSPRQGMGQRQSMGSSRWG